MYQAVTRIINEWDPIGLLMHAPDDEYEAEIEEIVSLLDTTDDATRLGQAIWSTFTRTFGDDRFTKSLSECTVIATRIILAIHPQPE